MHRYVGQEDGLHIMRHYFRDRDGAFTKYFGADYFDAAGRRVQSDRESFDHRFVYEPYDCVTGMTGTCAHQRTLYDAETGAVKDSVTKHFEITRTGDRLRIIRNAQSNRLSRTQTLNAANFPVSQREPDPQFADNWRLIQTLVPVR